MTVPSVGRVVHFVSFLDSTCQAAIITGDPDPAADIPTVPVTVLPPNSTTYWAVAGYDEGKASGTWHWPERV